MVSGPEHCRGHPATPDQRWPADREEEGEGLGRQETALYSVRFTTAWSWTASMVTRTVSALKRCGTVIKSSSGVVGKAVDARQPKPRHVLSQLGHLGCSLIESN